VTLRFDWYQNVIWKCWLNLHISCINSPDGSHNPFSLTTVLGIPTQQDGLGFIVIILKLLLVESHTSKSLICNLLFLPSLFRHPGFIRLLLILPTGFTYLNSLYKFISHVWTACHISRSVGKPSMPERPRWLLILAITPPGITGLSQRHISRNNQWFFKSVLWQRCWRYKWLIRWTMLNHVLLRL